MKAILKEVLETIELADSTVNMKMGDMLNSYQVYNASKGQIHLFDVTKNGNSIYIEGIYKNASIDYPKNSDKKTMTQEDMVLLEKIYEAAKEKS